MSTKKFNFILSASAVGWQSVNKAQLGLRAFNREMAAGKQAASELKIGLSSAASSLVGIFGGLSAVALTKSIWDAGVAAEGFNNAFKAITGSADAAAREIEFVKGVAESLGLEFETTIGAYKGLAAASKGTALEGKNTRDIFVAVSEASTVLGLTADKSAMVLYALSQMMSKGKVSSEELTQQLGENLPGALNIAAEAMGVSSGELVKMMADGKLMSEDFLPKFADALRKRFAEPAKESSESALASINRLKNTWFEFKTAIAEAGFLDMASGKIKDLNAALSDPAVKARVVEMANAFFDMAVAVAEFAVKYGKMLALLGLGAVSFNLLVSVVGNLRAVFMALNGAILSVTGTSLIAWLVKLRAATTGIALGMGATFAVTMGVAGAFIAAALAIKNLIDLYYEKKQLLVEIEAQTRANAAANQKLAARFDEISKSTGVTVKSMQDLDKAVKDGRLRYDETVGAWVKGSATIAEAAKDTAATQKNVVLAVTDEMKKAYQKYADDVRRIQGEIANGEKSLVAQLREMGRTGMSDLGAWQDRKREAEEYFAASKKALAEAQAALKAGDEVTANAKFDEAKQLAGEAKTAYAELNKAVEVNGKTMISQQDALRTAMAGVQESGTLGIEILKNQEAAAIAAGKALDAATGGQLAKDLPEVAKAFGELNVAAEELVQTSEDFNKAWKDAWDRAQLGGQHAIAAMEKDLKALTKDRHIKIYVQEIKQRATGGLAGVPGFAVGGSPSTMLQQFRRLSNPYITRGSGIKDDVPAMLKRYEFIQPEESVRHYGLRFMEMIRRRLLPKPMGFAVGGSPSGPVSLSGNSGGGAAMVFNNPSFHFSGEISRESKQNGRELARQVMRELEKMHKGASR